MKARVARTSITLVIALLTWFVVSVSPAAAAPANDNFASAQTVGPALPVSVAASNIGATAEPAEQPIYGNPVSSSIWFKWTAGPTTAGQVVVNLCGAGFTGDEFPFEKFAVRTSFGQVVPVAETVGECSTRFLAISGTTYYIQVDYGSDQGDFTFRMRKLTPPANDNFASPTVVGPAVPFSVAASNVDSSWEAGEPAVLGGSTNSRSVWFSWTAPSTGRFRLDMCTYTLISGAGNKSIVVYTGNTLGTLVSVVSGTSNCELDFAATSGTTYRIAFSGSFIGEMNFTFKMESAPPPGNDNFANATVVGPGLPVLLAGDNNFATVELNEPDHSGIGPAAHSVWYSWTPAANARVRIKSCSKTFNARIGVYTGTTVGALTQAAELPPYAPHCAVLLNAVAGTTYRIAAAGGPQDGEHGAFSLDIHAQNRPANDDFANAQPIGSTLPVSLNGTTVDATAEPSEPSHANYGGGPTASVWYRWIAPSAEAAIFSACSTGEPVRLAVYSGAVLDDLTQIDQADDGCAAGTEGGRLAIAPVAGEAYMIAVASQDRDYESAFAFSAGDPVLAPPPANGFNLKKAIAKCRKIKGKGRKARKKRANCIRQAKKKAAIINCRKIVNAKAEAKCIRSARKKFG